MNAAPCCKYRAIPQLPCRRPSTKLSGSLMSAASSSVNSSPSPKAMVSTSAEHQWREPPQPAEWPQICPNPSPVRQNRVDAYYHMTISISHVCGCQQHGAAFSLHKAHCCWARPIRGRTRLLVRKVLHDMSRQVVELARCRSLAAAFAQLLLAPFHPALRPIQLSFQPLPHT